MKNESNLVKYHFNFKLNTIHEVLLYFIFLKDPYAAVASLDCILSKQPNLSLKDASGKTALDTAIEDMKDQCHRARNAHLNENERTKLMTLMCLIIRLLEAGATVDVAALNSILIDCAYCGDFNGMKALILHGANMHCRDTSGSSILHLCWSYCKTF